VLFPLAAAGHCREPHDRAVQTVDHEVELLKQFIVDGTVDQDAVIGAPSLIIGYRWTHNHFYQATAGMGIRFIGGQIVADPESFAGMFASPVAALGATAYEVFDYLDATGKEDMVELGMEVIGKARADYWDAEKGVYSDEAMGIWDWSEALMLMALASAYKVTGDEELLQHAEELAASTKALLWDEEKGGFFAYPDCAGKGLSGLAFLARAFLLLYEVTADPEHLSTAAATLDYCFSSELYDGDLIHHDWTEEYGTATSYCTGCNFFVLSNLWLHQELSADTGPGG